MVVIEGNMVIECTSLADAFVMLFSLIYVLHRSYPKDLVNTFAFIQKVIMGSKVESQKSHFGSGVI